MVLSLPFGGKGALLTAPLKCGQEPSGRRDGRFSATLRAEGGTHRPCADCIDRFEATQAEGYAPKLVEGVFCELRPNAARERKMVRSVQGAPVSVPYRKGHPGSPNTSVLVVDYQNLGGQEGSCLATPWATATSFRAFWVPEGWPRSSWPTTGSSAATSR